MKLVIVESPAKAKTIAKYLGKDFTVDASRGHILDLPEKSLGVDINNNYKPEYKPKTKDQKDTIARLQAKCKSADEVYLATDPDREGEAISWHLQMALKLDPTLANRITFNEISQKAVSKAIANPTVVNMNLVNAQQARRVLDRLVGYTVSPVLCKKISGKLSAGRVQSSALRIVVDRELEIKAFVPKEYWNITAMLNKVNHNTIFKAQLSEVNGKKVDIGDKLSCDNVLAMLENQQYIVDNIKKSVTSSKPLPPFTTSTLQQDAVNKLRMSSSIAMQIAQQLYEGIDLPGKGHVALVTYIRTDSVRVSSDAIEEARQHIANKYGSQYIPDTPNYYSGKKGNVQDAHEAIRPINVNLTPEQLKSVLQPNQYKLYKLIYERFLASQSVKATYNSVNVSIRAGECKFTATGRTLLFDGYTAIYADSKPDKDDKEDKDVLLPELTESEVLNLHQLKHEQKFTKPPARYTEASLIKAMEERGIGRPSTYAATMSTLYKRQYVVKDGKSLVATELGMVVTKYLEENFSSIVDVEFTASMEDRLDAIEEEGTLWYKVVDEIYKPISVNVTQAMGKSGLNIPDEPSDEKCEKCGSDMVYKVGRYGKYLQCVNAECKHNKSLKAKSAPKETDIKCELCGSVMLEREGRNGKFLACSNYPKCKNTKSLSETVAKCPMCGKDIHKRLTKRGKIFYGCSGYPSCDFATWDIPTGKLCEQCNHPLVYIDSGDSRKIKCSNKNCNYQVDAPEVNGES